MYMYRHNRFVNEVFIYTVHTDTIDGLYDKANMTPSIVRCTTVTTYTDEYRYFTPAQCDKLIGS